MSFSVQDIIKDAFDRTGIYPGASASGVPEDMASMGLKLLRGLIDGYNVRNMIMFSQSKTETTVPEDGVINVTAPGSPSGFGNIASIQKVMVKLTEDQAGELDFVPYQDFDLHPNGAWVYTYRQCPTVMNDGDDWEISLKPSFAGRKVIVHYNRPIPCNSDTEYSIPDEYRELFTLGLGVKLFTVYPRQDERMRNYFVQELEAITHSITAKQGESKMLMYNRYGRPSLAARGDAGTFLMGG